MALLTGRRESAGDVVRILRTVVVLLMAANTSTRRALELASHVARIAFQARMSTDKSEPRELLVIEFRPLPGIQIRVALLARGGESQGPVVRGRRLHVRVGVAANAVRRKPCKASRRALLVARFTVQSRVGA